MPLHRDPDGNIRKEKTKPTDRRKDPSPPTPRGSGQSPGARRLEDDTVPVGKQSPTPQRGGQSPGARRLEDDTVPVGKQSPTPQQRKSHQEADGMSDPVVGWLVIVKGPGKGKALQLGNHNNIIGRGKGARVQLDFGDLTISRKGHAIVSYDPQDRTFHLEKYQDSTNLTYLNGKAVRNSIELPSLSHIHLGATVLRFVPLCGDAFDWHDTEESAEA